ncbi:hypothetical protein VD792_33040, partial [Pseudomonas aeruginosa]|uniref:hypothetical protein n=1 Tax=Pseudomonas aeruginosa TaxID=287 RepID=UPI002B47A7B4
MPPPSVTTTYRWHSVSSKRNPGTAHFLRELASTPFVERRIHPKYIELTLYVAKRERHLAVAEAECNTVTGLKQVHHAATPLPL